MLGLVLKTSIGVIGGLGSLVFFAALPTTTNYSLQSYGFGSGGTQNSSTGSYSLEGITGEVSSQADNTATYTLKPGYIQDQQANMPSVTMTNPSNYYDKLHFVIDAQGNPSDALYALRIQTTSTTCSSPTATYYVKSDLTIGASLTVSDYQNYSTWGGAGGANIIGLSPNTTYCLSAKATQGKFTESGYGPASSASTVGQQITFCLYTNANCAAGGHSESLSLLPGTVATSGNIGVDLSTNADAGGSVYIYSTGALTSTSHPGTPINSSSAGSTANLGSAAKGYGAQINTAVSMSKITPFEQSNTIVGSLSTTVQKILTAAAPVNSTGNQIQLQAKSDNTIKTATDYTDTVTVIAAASF
jgi:hypothetical protein